nr:immunoglobulin light chain junction region [Mus musculus]NSM01523.1 immunoglobulin light chain junction region [Mus musculus]NSM02706.1 immunoglobulin light chain junction region [Mus musculus]
CQQGYTLPRTF